MGLLSERRSIRGLQLAKRPSKLCLDLFFTGGSIRADHPVEEEKKKWFEFSSRNYALLIRNFRLHVLVNLLQWRGLLLKRAKIAVDMGF